MPRLFCPVGANKYSTDTLFGLSIIILLLQRQRAYHERKIFLSLKKHSFCKGFVFLCANRLSIPSTTAFTKSSCTPLFEKFKMNGCEELRHISTPVAFRLRDEIFPFHFNNCKAAMFSDILEGWIVTNIVPTFYQGCLLKT